MPVKNQNRLAGALPVQWTHSHTHSCLYTRVVRSESWTVMMQSTSRHLASEWHLHRGHRRAPWKGNSNFLGNTALSIRSPRPLQGVFLFKTMTGPATSEKEAMLSNACNDSLSSLPTLSHGWVCITGFVDQALLATDNSGDILLGAHVCAA